MPKCSGKRTTAVNLSQPNDYPSQTDACRYSRSNYGCEWCRLSPVCGNFCRLSARCDKIHFSPISALSPSVSCSTALAARALLPNATDFQQQSRNGLRLILTRKKMWPFLKYLQGHPMFFFVHFTSHQCKLARKHCLARG